MPGRAKIAEKSFANAGDLTPPGDFTEDVFAVYKAHRSRFGNQGCGPMQLTAPGFQDRADALGGCWSPIPNMQAAADWIRERHDAGLDWHGIARSYNGSDAYADHNDELRAKWRDIIL